jgi:hypothetical protein
LNILLKKNKSLWNFREFVALIENYLSDRNQKVVLQNCLSEVGNIKGGVPQGSVLAFIIHMLLIYYKIQFKYLHDFLMISKYCGKFQ